MIVRTVVPLIVFESVRIRELEQGIPSLQSGVGTDQGGPLRPEAVRFGVVEFGDGIPYRRLTAILPGNGPVTIADF